MIANLLPYPKMNATGVSWLGEVPAHWEATRLKNAARLVMGQSPSSDDCSTERIGLPFLQGCAEFGPDHPRPKQFCRAPAKVSPEGAVLISVRAPVGRLNFADQEYGIGRGLCAVVPDSRALSPAFARYCLGASTLGLALLSTGSTYDAVSVGDVAGLPVLVPPLGEQDAIVRFLDHVDRRIRRYIRAKQKLITLLEEQKQTIIRRAVTRGLDPNVRLKPSGVDWLEDVPEHWDLRPAKWHFREADERSETGSEELLSVSHITGVTPRSEKNITMFLAASNAGYKLCRPGDLVINTMWAWMAALGVAKQAGIVSPSYAVYRPNRSSGLLGQYADLLLCTAPYKSEYLCRSTGIRSSRLRMYPEEFLRLRLLCPPLEEQRTIVDVVNKESADTRRAIELAHSELSLLSEYRTRLIADVVTGKLDVREAAARLPNEAEEPEPLEETDSLTDGEKELTDDLDAVPEEAEV